MNAEDFKKRPVVLILGAGRVCRPAAELLASVGDVSSSESLRICQSMGIEEIQEFQVVVASLYKRDAEEVCLWFALLYFPINAYGLHFCTSWSKYQTTFN